jgi:hypothetical protein
MSRVYQLIREQVNFDSRLRNPVHWLLWLSMTFLVVVVVFDWRPPEVLEPLFIASVFLPDLLAIILLVLYILVRFCP